MKPTVQLWRRSSSCFKRSFTMSTGIRAQLREYHSYPAPDDAGVVTTARSSTAKQLAKTGSEFHLDPKFQFDTVFPGVFVAGESSESKQLMIPKTETTVLENGMIVASQDTTGLMTSLTVTVKSGSSFETQSGPNSNIGATQMIEMNAFWSTKNRTRQSLLEEMEQLGGMVQCVANRDSINYCIDILRENVAQGIDVLADAVVNPTFPEDEIAVNKSTTEYLLQELPADVISKDAIQMVAFSGPMGNAYFCPSSELSSLTPEKVRAFHRSQVFGSNCILAGCGIDHKSLVQLAREKFSGLPKSSPLPSTKQKSSYKGGLLVQQREMKEPFVKVTLGFGIGGWNDEMMIAVSVLQALLGGGSSFSAGGPGKGMYTRLYQETLCMHHWVESAEAFAIMNDEVGVMGIDGGCAPEYIHNMIREIVSQLCRLSVEKVSDIELTRAKNMFKSLLMMQLESRLSSCEDIGRQIATFGVRRPSSYWCDKIDSITANDLMAVARRMLMTDPAVAIVGHDVSNAPSYELMKNFTDNVKDQLSKFKSGKSLF